MSLYIMLNLCLADCGGSLLRGVERLLRAVVVGFVICVAGKCNTKNAVEFSQFCRRDRRYCYLAVQGVCYSLHTAGTIGACWFTMYSLGLPNKAHSKNVCVCTWNTKRWSRRCLNARPNEVWESSIPGPHAIVCNTTPESGR